MKSIINVIIIVFTCFNAFAADNSFYLQKKDGKKITITTQNLESMPVYKISTSTNFTNKSEYSGVKFSTLLEKYGISGTEIRVFAWDDYSYTIPVKELLKYNVIVAYKKNGQYIPISDLGPYAVIYPRDENPELKNLDVNARTVWQMKGMEVN